MIASERFDVIQETNPHQAFLPIFATLFFAITTSPILMGFGEYEARSRATGPIREGKNNRQIVIARCEMAEHGQPGHRCAGRRS